MQIIAFNVAQGPKSSDLDDRLYPAVRVQISVGEGPFEETASADVNLTDAQAAASGEGGNEAIGFVATQAVKKLRLDSYIIDWLKWQIVVALSVVLPHMRDGRILRAVQDLWEPGGTLMGQIWIETPIWRHFFDNWCQRRVDEKHFYSGLVRNYFDRDDAKLFLLAPDEVSKVERELAFGISTKDAHAEAVLDSVRGINCSLPGDLQHFAPQLREAADAAIRMAMITKKVVRLYDIIRDSDGMGLAAYTIEAPFYRPDPNGQFPTDVWIDGVFRPQARVKEVA